jgi:hypothetical protein
VLADAEGTVSVLQHFTQPEHIRYAVYGQKIVPGAAVAATLGGDPTDIH